jgi:hypothetical protein
MVTCLAPVPLSLRKEKLLKVYERINNRHTVSTERNAVFSCTICVLTSITALFEWRFRIFATLSCVCGALTLIWSIIQGAHNMSEMLTDLELIETKQTTTRLEECYPPRYRATKFSRNSPTRFICCLLLAGYCFAYSSILNMETVYPSETSVIFWITWNYIPGTPAWTSNPTWSIGCLLQVDLCYA